MDLEYGERYEEFRREVRAFVEQHKREKPLARDLTPETRGELIRWLSLLIEHGYWARTIPKEYGGYGAAPDLLDRLQAGRRGLSRRHRDREW